MALPGSGAISLSAIQTEFGGSNPISISEYYKGGGLVPNTATNVSIPVSGTINFANFYLGSVVSFTPTTVTRTSGTAATETVPTGATNVRIRVGGGGGAGGLNNSGAGPGGGGGEGGFCELNIAVVGGNTLTYTVGGLRLGRATVGNGNAGNASTVSGTVSGGAVSMTANGGGGGGGVSQAAGTGGTASGGSTNTTGAAGATGGAGGAGGTGNSLHSGTGGIGDEFDGVVSSGSGIRGEIEFYYT